MTGYHETVRKRALLQHRLELHDSHGWQRRQIIRINELQQVLRKFRELGIDPQLNTCSKKRESF